MEIIFFTWPDAFNWEHIICCSSILFFLLLLLHWLMPWFPLRPSIFLFIRPWSVLCMPVHVQPHYYVLWAVSLAESSQEVRGDAGRLSRIQAVPTRGWQDVAEESNATAQMWGSAEFPSFRKVTHESSDQQPANFMHFTAPPLRRHMAFLMWRRPTSAQFLTSQWRTNANIHLLYLPFTFFRCYLFCTQT